MAEKYSGQVQIVNRERGRVAINVDGYGFTVLETDSDEVELGDVLVGDLRSIGDTRLLNRTRGVMVAGYIDDFDVTPAAVRAVLR